MVKGPETLSVIHHVVVEAEGGEMILFKDILYGKSSLKSVATRDYFLRFWFHSPARFLLSPMPPFPRAILSSVLYHMYQALYLVYHSSHLP